MKILAAVCTLLLAAGCSFDRVERSRATAISDPGKGPTFPKDSDELAKELLGRASGKAVPYDEYINLLRSKPKESASLLHEALEKYPNVQKAGVARATLIYALGDLGNEGSISVLDKMLAVCLERKKKIGGPALVDKLPKPKIGGKKQVPPPGSLAPSSPEGRGKRATGPIECIFHDDKHHERSVQAAALQALEAIVSRYPTAPKVRAYRGVIERFLSPKCDLHLVSTAARTYVRHARDKKAAREYLAAKLGDLKYLAYLEASRLEIWANPDKKGASGAHAKGGGAQ